MSPRGGDRGGRRPAIPDEMRRKTLNCRVAPETLDFLNAERDRTGRSIGQVVDHLAETHRADDRWPDKPEEIPD